MLIEMTIKGLMVDPVTNMPIVILKDKDGDRVLPIWVAITLSLAGMVCCIASSSARGLL